MSLSRALKMLGYKCSNSNLQFYELLFSGRTSYDHAQWYAALQAKFFGKRKVFEHKDWDRLHLLFWNQFLAIFDHFPIGSARYKTKNNIKCAWNSDRR